MAVLLLTEDEMGVVAAPLNVNVYDVAAAPPDQFRVKLVWVIDEAVIFIAACGVFDVVTLVPDVETNLMRRIS